jgi:hypothetical protein
MSHYVDFIEKKLYNDYTKIKMKVRKTMDNMVEKNFSYERVRANSSD